MKILSVGNSFSQDAHHYIHRLAEFNGLNIQTTNLYIPGCSLEHHFECFKSNSNEYDFEPNGGAAVKKVSLIEGLESDKYDVVTLQQASHASGMPQTYFPYLEKLIEICKKKQPDAKIMFHKTWAYETDFNSVHFDNYGKNQYEMYRRITDCNEMVNKIYDLPIIPVGTVIQKLRNEIPDFDYGNGGKSLCRDGFHLTYDYGRLTASYVWIRAIVGKSIKLNGFDSFDSEITAKIEETAETVFLKGK